MTFYQEIKQNLEKGENYGTSNWYTINRHHKDGLKVIVINDKDYFFESLDSYARKVKKLLNRGV